MLAWVPKYVKFIISSMFSKHFDWLSVNKEADEELARVNGGLIFRYEKIAYPLMGGRTKNMCEHDRKEFVAR